MKTNRMDINTANCTKQQFPRKIILNLNQKIKHKNSSYDEDYGDKNKIWTSFTYYSQTIREITNLSKQTNIGIAFITTNTIQQLMKQKQTSNTQETDSSGIYKLTCNTCQMVYIGQINCSIRQRYQELIRYIKFNNPQSAYAQYILNNRHEYGPIDNNMSLLKQVNNNSLLLLHEQLHIKTHRLHNQLISE